MNFMSADIDRGAVFVLDDDASMRKSIRWLIEDAGYTVREFENAQEFLESTDAQDAGCLLLDVRMPGMSGIELQHELQLRSYRMPVIVITAHADVPMAVNALKLGAMDFIEKPFNEKVLLDRVRRALEEDVNKREEAADVDQVVTRMERLTHRERQVMELVISGASNKEMAAALEVTCKTIEAHRAKVMSKMEAGSLAELVRACMRVEGAA